MSKRTVQVSVETVIELIFEVEWFSRQDPGASEAYAKDVEMLENALEGEGGIRELGIVEVEYDEDEVCDFLKFSLDAIAKDVDYS